MSLFADSMSSSNLEQSLAAGDQAKSYEKLLALRISLQKVVDNSNKLPVLNDDSSVRHDLENNHNNYDECLENCSSALRSLTKLLTEQSSSSFSPADDEEMTWERLYAPQKKLREDWEAVVNKWHARLNFGSEKAQSNLRVFNQKIWEQIETN